MDQTKIKIEKKRDELRQLNHREAEMMEMIESLRKELSQKKEETQEIKRQIDSAHGQNFPLIEKITAPFVSGPREPRDKKSAVSQRLLSKQRSKTSTESLAIAQLVASIRKKDRGIVETQRKIVEHSKRSQEEYEKLYENYNELKTRLETLNERVLHQRQLQEKTESAIYRIKKQIYDIEYATNRKKDLLDQKRKTLKDLDGEYKELQEKKRKLEREEKKIIRTVNDIEWYRERCESILSRFLTIHLQKSVYFFLNQEHKVRANFSIISGTGDPHIQIRPVSPYPSHFIQLNEIKTMEISDDRGKSTIEPMLVTQNGNVFRFLISRKSFEDIEKKLKEFQK